MAHPRLLLSAGGLLLLSTFGCVVWRPATPEILTERAVAYNLAAAKAQEKLLLLNIVRAMRHEPRYFTTIGQIVANPRDTTSANLNIPFGGDAPSTFALGLGGNRSHSDWSATITTLESKEFTTGLLEPVSLEVIDYFWQQGWPKELLLSLFIRRIDLPGCEPVFNHPEDPLASASFHVSIEALIAHGLRIVETPSEPLGEALALTPNLELGKFLLEAQKAKVNVDFESGKYLIRTAADAKMLDWDRKGLDLCAVAHGCRCSASADSEIKFYFRSPEGVIYYLGQMMRMQARNAQDLVMIHSEPTSAPKRTGYHSVSVGEERALFIARAIEPRRAERSRSLVEVEHQGTTYAIPAETTDQRHYSMSVLTLVGQLIDLNKLRSELPTTGVITVVGGG